MKNNNCLNLDHNLIEGEIEKSIKIYKWEYILPDLPKDSFLVGGYIRDLIIGKQKKKQDVDVDIIVPNKAYEVGRNIAEKYQGKFVVLDKDRDIVRVILEGLNLDIASQISDSLIEDISSRDFTINSISFSLDSKLIFDPLNGIGDLHKSLLRTYREQNLIDDPLRILRCFRFVSELNFNIDNNLFSLIQLHKNKLASVSVERIQYELKKIFKGENAINSILLIKKTYLFQWLQAYKMNSYIFDGQFDLNYFFQEEIEKFLPMVYLTETLNDLSIQKLKFSRSESAQASSLRKWKNKVNQKPIGQFNEIERFSLHKELENILPAFIIYLPNTSDQIDWLNRWRNKEDKLFHPTNLLNGETLKKYIKINDGPLLGQLLNFLSQELAFNRLNNFDDAIYKANQWFQQNAPKYD